MAGQQQFPQRIKTILDDPTLRLSAEPLPNGTGRPTLKVFPNGKNSYRIDIFTNMPGEESNGNIRADIGYVDFQAVCETLLHLADPATPNGTLYKWESVEFQFFGGKRSETKQLVYTAFAGKDDNGAVYFSVKLPKADRSTVQFFFDSALRLHMKRVKGGDMSRAEISGFAVRAWVNRVNFLMNVIAPTVWVDKSQNRQGGNGGQGGGGYNNNRGGNNGGGGYNNNNYNRGGQGGGNSAPEAEDLPF